MIEKFKRHPHKAHYLAYCFNYVAYGMLITGLGPLIPYFTERTGIIETDYTFLFSCRSFGMLFGAILQKVIQHHTKLTHHFLLSVASALLVFTTTLFAWADSPAIQGLWMVLSSICYSAIEIGVNIVALRVNPSEDLQFWLLLLHGFFGVGGLIGPLVVFALGINAFSFIGLLFVILSIAYWRLLEPDTASEAAAKEGGTVQDKVVPRSAEIILCMSLFLYIGMECTYGGWISSYAVLVGASGMQEATLFPSIFWVMITVFRFALACLPGTTSSKMQYLLYGNIATAIVSLLLVKAGMVWLACSLSAVAFGIAMSSIYILIISLTNQFGLTLGEHQTGNIITCSVLGEGLLTMVVGLLMQHKLQAFFYSLLVMPIILQILRRACVEILIRERKTGKELGVELLDRQTVK